VGLRRSSPLAPAAYVVTLFSFLTRGVSQFSLPEILYVPPQELSRAVDILASGAPPTTMQALSWMKSFSYPFAAHTDYASLSWWSTQLQERHYDLIIDGASAPDRARLRCVRGESAGAWLEPCPMEPLGLSLRPEEFTVLIKWWLGLNVAPLVEASTCPLCGDTMDVFGDHVLCCRKSGFYTRHQAVVEFLWYVTTAAGFGVHQEVALSNGQRPADLLLSHWKGGGPLAIDVSITHPLGPSQHFHRVSTGVHAAEVVEKMKCDRCEDSCAQECVRFSPFVLTTFGTPGPLTQAFFKDLVNLLVPQGPRNSRRHTCVSSTFSNYS
jgi:hypothetical protein